MRTWEAVESVRRLSPVVHNITNYVVMNNTANALLALGASPVMAHAEEEVADMVGIASALVLNIGTLSREWIKAMHMAGERGRGAGHPGRARPGGRRRHPLPHRHRPQPGERPAPRHHPRQRLGDHGRLRRPGQDQGRGQHRSLP